MEQITAVFRDKMSKGHIKRIKQAQDRIFELLKNEINDLSAEDKNDLVEAFFAYGKNQRTRLQNLINNDDWISSLTHASAEEISSHIETKIQDYLRFDNNDINAILWQKVWLDFITQIVKNSKVMSLAERADIFGWLFEINDGFEYVATNPDFLNFVETWPKYLNFYGPDFRMAIFKNIKPYWDENMRTKYYKIIVEQTKNLPESFIASEQKD
jgi:hypothetical protein